jgi:hypothetical protein
MEYYRMMECPECDTECYALCYNGIEHKGRPVFDPQMFACECETCPECGTIFGTGDIDIITD